MSYVLASMVTGTHTHTYKTTNVTLAHAPRVNNMKSAQDPVDKYLQVERIIGPF